MSHSNASGIDNLRTHYPLCTPASKEDDSIIRSGYIDDINFILACLEGCFLYEGGTLHDSNTGFQSESVTNIRHIMSTSPPLSPREHIANSAHLGGLTMTEATTSSSPSAAAAASAPPDYFAFIPDLDFYLEPLFPPHVCHVFVLTLSKDLKNFSSIPSSLRDGIGDQINPLLTNEALASNLVRTGTANERDIADQGVSYWSHH
ncbi:hypothetical protein EI94DRAFT_1744552 [Lactarius quietus]|nr:hypothetical protein EI94DRAFT_1744552 [Lactarius quietus]